MLSCHRTGGRPRPQRRCRSPALGASTSPHPRFRERLAGDDDRAPPARAGAWIGTIAGGHRTGPLGRRSNDQCDRDARVTFQARARARAWPRRPKGTKWARRRCGFGPDVEARISSDLRRARRRMQGPRSRKIFGQYLCSAGAPYSRLSPVALHRRPYRAGESDLKRSSLRAAQGRAHLLQSVADRGARRDECIDRYDGQRHGQRAMRRPFES
jgi:hypothetical protein